MVLRAVADGDRKFIGLVVADANSEELPVPDGAARQVLAEYGDFPVYLVNRDLRARRVTTHELFPSFFLCPVCLGCAASWLDRAVRNQHRHAIEQVSRRWRGGQRGDSGRTRRKILISTQLVTPLIEQL